jgi:DNA-binding response OmpR family regulator
MLNGLPILVAEDEPFIAIDIEYAVQDAGGTVVGPAASVQQAMALVDTRAISGAILDVNLLDGNISPVVERLLGKGIPVVLQSGVGLPMGLLAMFPSLIVLIKPMQASQLVLKLGALISSRQFPSRD